ncbi:10118_t:CDS:1, partial [Funneliformis geosporum]
KPAWQMMPAPMMIVREICKNFVTSFIDCNIQNTIPDKLIHDGFWKESEENRECYKRSFNSSGRYLD